VQKSRITRAVLARFDALGSSNDSNNSITVQSLELQSIFVIVTIGATKAWIISAGFPKMQKIERGVYKKKQDSPWRSDFTRLAIRKKMRMTARSTARNSRLPPEQISGREGGEQIIIYRRVGRRANGDRVYLRCVNIIIMYNRRSRGRSFNHISMGVSR
jgi:hypothetical protein